MKTADLPYYECDGLRYPRVTSILSILRNPDLEDWQANVGMAAAKRTATHATKVGKTLDGMIKQQIRGEKVLWPRQSSSEIKQGWKAWEEYCQLHPARPSLRFHVGEIRVSRTYGYGGEPDLIEHLRITDIKATTHLHTQHWIQVMAYVPLVFPEEYWKDITVQLIRLDTFLGTYESPPARPFNPAIWATFLKLKDVYVQWFMPKEEEKEKELSHVAER